MTENSWRPSASLQVLKKRAQLLHQLRAFFYERNVMEVDVPVITAAAVSDVNIEPISVLLQKRDSIKEFFLTTSPEFYMKRLLAAGSGSIFYLGKAFRQEESGAKHHYEFTLLEWYRVGWDEIQLIEEVLQLIQRSIPGLPLVRTTYGELFRKALSIDPYNASDSELRKLCQAKIEFQGEDFLRNDYLDLLFTHCIEPDLEGITVITQYPATMAALAKKSSDQEGNPVARRFEVFIDSLELANGYYELIDVNEQRHRFERDQLLRKQLGKNVRSFDEPFLAALESGLPGCAGVAMGIDRLLMVLLKQENIHKIMPFGSE